MYGAGDACVENVPDAAIKEPTDAVAGVSPRTTVTVVGDGTRTVLECVGTQDAINTAIAAVRGGGAIGRVGAAQYTDVPMDFGAVMRNIT